MREVALLDALGAREQLVHRVRDHRASGAPMKSADPWITRSRSPTRESDPEKPVHLPPVAGEERRLGGRDLLARERPNGASRLIMTPLRPAGLPLDAVEKATVF